MRLDRGGGRHRHRRPVRRVEGGRRRGDDRGSRSRHFGRLDIVFNNVGVPTPRLGPDLRGAHRRGLRPAVRDQRRGRVPRLQARGHAVQGAGRRRRDPQHRVGRRTRRRGAAASTAPPRARCTSSPRRWPSRARRSASACNAICPAGMPYTNFTAAGGHDGVRRAAWSRSRERVGVDAPARPADHRRGLRRGRGVPRVGRGDEHHRRAAAGRRRVRRHDDRDGRRPAARPRASCGELFDLRSSYNAHSGGGYTDDPYPMLARAARAGAGARGHRARAHRLSRATGSSRACRTPTGRTSRRSATRRATPPSATPRCSRRHAAEESIDTPRTAA